MSDTPIPSAVESEEQVVGSVLLDPSQLPAVVAIVEPGQFVDALHQEAFCTILELHKNGEPISAVTVCESLRKSEVFVGADASAAWYLGATGLAVPTSAHAPYHAKQITEAAYKRELLQVSSSVHEAAMGGAAPEAIGFDARARLSAIDARYTNEADRFDAFEKWADGILSGEPAIETIDVAEHGSPLNSLLIGRGFVTLIGAPPASGKTALTGQLVYDALFAEGQRELRVLVVNVEMTANVLRNRQLARLADISLNSISFTGLSELERERVKPVLLQMQELEQRGRLIYFTCGPYSVDRIKAAVAKHKPDIVLIDYLQEIRAGDDRMDRMSRLALVMQCCRDIADENRAVIAISSVSRGEGNYDAKKLGLASLKHSGDIEFAADAVYLLRREEGSPQAELGCVKNRHGKLGEICLDFDGCRQRFNPSLGAWVAA